MPRPHLLIGLLTLLLPCAASALMINAQRPTHDVLTNMHYSSSSKKSASSIAPAVSMHSWNMALGFQVPSPWEKYLESTDYFVVQHKRDAVMQGDASILRVRQDRLEKEHTPDELFTWFQRKATLMPTSDTIAIDWYIPSYTFIAKKTVKVAGRDALFVEYGGEKLGSKRLLHSVFFVTDKWLYSITLDSLSAFADEDRNAFDMVLSTFKFSKSASSSSSTGPRANRALPTRR